MRMEWSYPETNTCPPGYFLLQAARLIVWGNWNALCEESDMTERLPFHFSLSCIGEGNGNPLQCSSLENPRDGGAWWAAVYGVSQSRTRLKWLSSSMEDGWDLSIWGLETVLSKLLLDWYIDLFGEVTWATLEPDPLMITMPLCLPWGLKITWNRSWRLPTQNVLDLMGACQASEKQLPSRGSTNTSTPPVLVLPDVCHVMTQQDLKQWADFYQPPSSSTIWHTEVNWSFIDSTFPWHNWMWKQCFVEGLGDFFIFCRSAAWLETKIVWCQRPGPALGATGKKCAAQQAGSWVKALWGLSLGKELGWPLQGTQVGEGSSPPDQSSPCWKEVYPILELLGVSLF